MEETSTLTDGQKAGFVGGLLGGIVGGFCWIVILGIILQLPIFIVVPILLGIIIVTVAWLLLRRYPERAFSIMGLAVFWIFIIDLALANLLYPQIPEAIGGMSTGRGDFDLIYLNCLLAGLAIFMGSFFIIKDIIKEKGFDKYNF